jgi:uncharacterized protein (TIGR02466 family)
MIRLVPGNHQALFASPLLQFNIADANRLNVSLIAEISAKRSSDEGVRRSNRNGWHSRDDLFALQTPAMRDLQMHIREAISAATQIVSPKFDFPRWRLQTEGWINVSGRGAYNSPHDHPAFAWSGVYYVSIPAASKPDSGAIEFVDPRTNARVPTIAGASCFLDTFKLQPVAGLMMIFPSYLRHWVYPNEEDAERISIAFNARYIPAQ